MTITVLASGILKDQIPKELKLEASTVGEAVSQLDLPEVGEMILLVNGRMAHWQTALQDGDLLKLVPAIGGGEARLVQDSDLTCDWIIINR